MAIENNAKNRTVQATIFESQKIITDIRIERYKNICTLINDIKSEIVSEYLTISKLDMLKLSLMNDFDLNLFFKYDSPKTKTPIFLKTTHICDKITEIKTKSRNDNGRCIIKEGINHPIFDDLTTFTTLVELYIIGQLLRNEGVEKHIKDNIYIDSTFRCYDSLVSEFYKSDTEKN
ncbi:MAG: hypothetical protein SNG35_04800 [Rikenellaceae bacterium]